MQISKLLTIAAFAVTTIASPTMARDRSVRHEPGVVAAGVVGGAIGTAAAIAATPLAALDAYAYDTTYGYDPTIVGRDSNYVDENAYDPVFQTLYSHPNRLNCQPGSWFTGADGRRYLCQ